jgi:large subunit ribosomal protein L22e
VSTIAAKKGAAAKIAKQRTDQYTIDCGKPVADKIFDIAAFATYLQQRIKVNGKAGNLGQLVTVRREETRIVVRSRAGFSKQYLKYLTKKFLKKNKIRDWLRVIATSKTNYELRYFNIQQNEDEEEEEEEDK